MDDMKRALEAVELLTNLMPERVGASVTKELLVMYGEILWPNTYKNAKNERDMEANFERHINMLKLVNPMEGLFYQESMQIPDNKILMPGSARWYGAGMPTYRLQRQTLFRLAQLEFTEEDLLNVTPPFPAFYLDFPADTIYVEDFDKKLLPSPGVFVHTIELLEDYLRYDGVHFAKGKRWHYAILTNTPTMQWQYNRTLDDLLDLHGDRKERNDYYNFINKKTGENVPLNDYDRLLNKMVSRIIVGFCSMALNDENFSRTIEAAKFPKEYKRTKTGPLSQRIFTEIIHDEKPKGEAEGERITGAD